MKQLKIAVSAGVESAFDSVRETVCLDHADLTEVSAIVMSAQDIAAGKLEAVEAKHFNLPVFAVSEAKEDLPVGRLHGVIDTNPTNKAFYGRQVDCAATKYEDAVLPPFFGSLEQYVQNGNSQFDCPGIKVVHSSAVTPLAVLSMNSLANRFSALTYAMPTSPWATF